MIHMAPAASAEGHPDSLLRVPVGRWEDDLTLIEPPIQLGWGHFDGQEIPSTTAAKALERFTLSPQGDRLDLPRNVHRFRDLC